MSSSTGQVKSITLGLDGNLWFTDVTNSAVGSLNLFATVNNADGTQTTTVTSEWDFTPFSYGVVDKQILVVDGSLGDVFIASGGTLRGHGTVSSIVAASGGHVAPGNSPGCINTGDLTMDSGSSLDVELAGTTVCTQYDQTKVTGAVDITDATLNTSLVNSFVPTIGQSFTIIDNDLADAVTGTFAGLAQGASFTANGVTYQISYTGGTGNDVVLTVTGVAASAPAAPNTGFGFISANPLATLGVATVAAATIAFTARRLKLAHHRS